MIRKLDEIAEIKTSLFTTRSYLRAKINSAKSGYRKAQHLWSTGKNGQATHQVIGEAISSCRQRHQGLSKAGAHRKYKNRVPAKLALPQKKTRRKHKVVSVLVPTVILAMLGVAIWLP